jgi:phosphatidate cytidylyltransferase
VLLKRTLTVLVFLAIITVVLSLSHHKLGSLLFLVVANVIVTMALHEFFLLFRAKGRVSLWYGVSCGVAYCTLVFFTLSNPLTLTPLPTGTISILGLILLLLFFARRILKGDYESGLFDFASLAAGFFFVAWLFSFVIRINYFPPAGRQGPWWVLSLVVIVGGADSFAYFFGKALGKTRFSPRISPNKTMEGLIGGTICGIALGVACKFAFGLKISLGQMLILATVLSLIDHIGDLAESLLKRDAGVKDSGRLPGVGGMLDMVDGILFAAPATYFFMQLWLV